MVRVFDEHGLDTDLLDTLPERFQSRFKAVQSEQRQIHNLALVTATKELDAKSFLLAWKLILTKAIAKIVLK